jgi:enterochelin esterase-like enzyme
MYPKDTLISPRMVVLYQALTSGNRYALEAFWDDVATHGTPLIESIPDDATHALVTFLWRGTDATQNVVVVSELGGLDFARNQMTHLLDTNLWYKTYRVRTDLRCVYLLSPNDSLIARADVDDWAARKATWQPDPLNRHPSFFPKDEPAFNRPEITVSTVELPDAPPQPWFTRQPNSPTGTVVQHRMRSTILANERRVWVYTPPGYTRSADAYCLLILFDGFAYTQVIPTPTILDNLLAAGLLPSLVAVLLDSPNRDCELVCYPPFVDFLAHELLPWIHQSYHVTSEPTQTVVGGFSYGGLAAAFAGLRYPHQFGNVLSQSGAFWWKPDEDEEYEWLARQFATSPVVPLHFYLDVGLLETAAAPGNGPSGLITNRHMRTVLQAKDYPVHYAEYNGGHDLLCWQGTLVDGLMALFGRTAANDHR